MRLASVWGQIASDVADGHVSYINSPLQSGSQWVLDRMNRPSNLAAALPVFSDLRKVYSGPLLTHVIVGAPYEELADIEETARVLVDHGFDDVSIHLFSARAGAKEVEREFRFRASDLPGG